MYMSTFTSGLAGLGFLTSTRVVGMTLEVGKPDISNNFMRR